MGKTQEDPAELKKQTDELYHNVHDLHQIVFQMLQLPGVDSHAWLVADMTPVANGGYTLKVIDSNEYGEDTYVYTTDQRFFTLSYDSDWTFVPYTKNDGELRDIQVAMLRACNPAEALNRWAGAIRDREDDMDDNAVEMAEQQIQTAVDTGVFGDFLREFTITDDDRKPENWAKLITGQAK
jgi:hypothetical protein